MIFLTKEQLFKIHLATLKAQGGSEGLRDENGLLSELASAENRFYYEDAGMYLCDNIRFLLNQSTRIC